MEDLKLYLIRYTVQQYSRPAMEDDIQYDPCSDTAFRVARNSQEAIRSFKRYITPKIKKSLDERIKSGCFFLPREGIPWMRIDTIYSHPWNTFTRKEKASTFYSFIKRFFYFWCNISFKTLNNFLRISCYPK